MNRDLLYFFQFEDVKKLTKECGNSTKPNYIFEVVPNEITYANFEEKRQGRELLYAYHGSRFENFHSILHNGLISHMNKVMSITLVELLTCSPPTKRWEGHGG